MRVLLFVQTGDARPKCVGGAVHFTRAGYRAGYNCKIASDPVMSALGDSKTAWGWWTTPGPWNALLAADRWWLVECANAEDGRTVVLQERVFDGTGIRSTLGRVLASGGKGGAA